MNRTLTLLRACAVLAAALSMTFTSDTKAETCPPAGGGPGKNVAWAWGRNNTGQLGDGTKIERHAPVRVQNLSGLVTVAAGGAHSLAIRYSRSHLGGTLGGHECTVWAWGLNDFGELGDGTTDTSTTPVQVLNLSGVTAVAGGMDFSLALKSDGTVWAWGRNSIGELGDGTTIDRHMPVQVLNLSGITAIGAGEGNGLALKSDGTVWAWGINYTGQLGDGTTIDRHMPVQVLNLTGITAIGSGDDHSLALKNDGTVWTWGYNDNGQLGDESTIARLMPVQVLSGEHPHTFLGGITAVAGGRYHSLALGSDGTVWAWGGNLQGELGDETTIARHRPVRVPHVSGVLAIAAGSGHSLAVRGNAIVQDWGWNMNGQLGDDVPTLIDRPYAVQVANLVENLTEVTAIAGGTAHSLAAGVSVTLLTVDEYLVHPDHNQLRLFNLMIDGVVVRTNVNAGTAPQRVSPGNHTVSETGGTGTSLSEFRTVIGGDCTADGTVNLALGDNKTCTITNYDNFGGCAIGKVCCDPGDGTEGCLRCGRPGLCP